MSKVFNFKEHQDISDFEIVRYSSEYKSRWNQCVSESSNFHFLFYRDYMEYHEDRFVDHSLVVISGDKVIAILPATEDKDIIYSHGGLTFGGLIHRPQLMASQEIRIFYQIVKYYRDKKYKTFIYKPSPWPYHISLCETDLYAISALGGYIVESHLATTIDYLTPMKFASGRKNQIQRAKKNGLLVHESDDWSSFVDLLKCVLKERHDATPVHTANELSLLQARFPNNIKLWIAEKDGILLAAVVLFITPVVIHTQYMASSDEGCYLGALDLILAKLIDDYKLMKRYFCFGISSERDGTYLNEGLLYQKESFGGRSIVHNIWKLDL